ncbi:MAG: hypothetical protein NVS1B16_08040 [Pseudarthrobacter sp.]
METQREAAEALVPLEDDSWMDESALAEHAAGAVAYAIRSWLTGDAQEACWAARQIYEALDFWVTTRDNLDLNAKGAEAWIMTHPLIQEELARQCQDLEELRMAGDSKLLEVLPRIKQRAHAQGPGVFGEMA